MEVHYHAYNDKITGSLAKQAIRKNQSVIVVEGNLDVIASHKAGVENALVIAEHIRQVIGNFLRSPGKQQDEIRVVEKWSSQRWCLCAED